MLTGCLYSKEESESNTSSEPDIEAGSESITDELSQMQDEEETQSTTEDAYADWIQQYKVVKTRDYYGGLLGDLDRTSTLPDGTGMEFLYSGYEGEEGNQFAIFDVDCDGREELLLSLKDTYSAGMIGQIYGYDPDTSILTKELSDYPIYTCYSNGTITMGWSHNQGLGPDFWPYNMYAYDKEQDIYTYQGNVDTWDKNYYETNYNGEPFPDDIDVNGDGVIYYLSDAIGNGFDVPKDNQDYETWLHEYTGDAVPVEIPWQDLTYDNYSNYYIENVSMFIQQYKEKKLDNETDIGLLFMEESEDTATTQIENLLKDNYGVALEDLFPEGISVPIGVQGTLDGETVYESWKEGAPQFTYMGKKIGDVTICGLYPGMSEEEAVALLLEEGFYLEYYDYVTGTSDGNYGISFISDNGTVTQINMFQVFTY